MIVSHLISFNALSWMAGLANGCHIVFDADWQIRFAIYFLPGEFMADAFHIFRVAFVATANPTQFVRTFYSLQNQQFD